MNQIPHSHPLDKLISDDRLFLLEAILPFVEGPMRMPLVIYLKMMELQQIMRVINNQSYIRQCDFNRDLHNQNDILTSLAQCGFPDIANQMKNMQQAMNMMQVMNAMNQMGTPESPPDSNFQNNVTEGRKIYHHMMNHEKILHFRIFKAFSRLMTKPFKLSRITHLYPQIQNIQIIIRPYRGTDQMRKFTIPPHMKTQKIPVRLISHPPNIATIP